MSVKIGDRFIERRMGMTMTSRMGYIETVYEVTDFLPPVYETTPVLCVDVDTKLKGLFNIIDVEQMVREYNENQERAKFINNRSNPATA